MPKLTILHSYGEEIQTRLSLKTFPIAVKLLENEEDIPQDVQRPLRDLGHHMATCQAISLARHDGQKFALMKEDMWCFESVLGLGLAELPQEFLDGHNCYPGSSRTLETGAIWAQEEFPHLEYGKYRGVACAPLRSTSFDPDLVIIYCDSAQLMQLVLSMVGSDGRDVQCKLSGRAACVYEIVPTMQENKCHLTVPCPGDRYTAMAQDNEMAFSVPKDKIEDLVMGVRYLDEQNIGFQRKLKLRPEYQLAESYVSIGKKIGMDVR